MTDTIVGILALLMFLGAAWSEWELVGTSVRRVSLHKFLAILIAMGGGSWSLYSIIA